MYTSQKIY